MLDACPRCGYSLQGLPADHACPECGLRYDRESEVYKHRNLKALFLGLLGFVGGAGGMVNLARVYGNAGALWRMGIIFCVVVYFVGAVWLARYVYRLYRSGPLVAILPDGLYVRLRRVEGQWTAWKDVSGVQFRAGVGRGGATLQVTGRRPLFIDGVFTSTDDARRFVSLVAARLETARTCAD